jgi:hypothetical protein
MCSITIVIAIKVRWGNPCSAETSRTKCWDFINIIHTYTWNIYAQIFLIILLLKILIPLIFPYVSILRSSYVCLYYDHLHTYISACKFSKISRNICPIFVFWILFFVPTLSVHLIWNPFGINLFLMQLSMAVT